MGLLKFFSKAPVESNQLPSGSFTIDRTGRILTSTLPQSFSRTLTNEISKLILQSFKTAQAAHLPLFEITVRYSNLKLSAREMRGGAIVYLSPPEAGSTSMQPRPLPT